MHSYRFSVLAAVRSYSLAILLAFALAGCCETKTCIIGFFDNCNQYKDPDPQTIDQSINYPKEGFFPILYERVNLATRSAPIESHWCDYLPTLFYVERVPRSKNMLKQLREDKQLRILKKEQTGLNWSIIRMPGLETSLIGTEAADDGRLDGYTQCLRTRFSFFFVPVSITSCDCSKD